MENSLPSGSCALSRRILTPSQPTRAAFGPPDFFGRSKNVIVAADDTSCSQLDCITALPKIMDRPGEYAFRMMTGSAHKLLISLALMLALFLSGGLGETYSILSQSSLAGSQSTAIDESSNQPELSVRACDGECAGEVRACSTTCVSAGMPSASALMDVVQATLRVSTTTCCLSGMNPALDPAPPKART